jgi:hypothetical protein
MKSLAADNTRAAAFVKKGSFSQYMELTWQAGITAQPAA